MFCVGSLTSSVVQCGLIMPSNKEQSQPLLHFLETASLRILNTGEVAVSLETCVWSVELLIVCKSHGHNDCRQDISEQSCSAGAEHRVEHSDHLNGNIAGAGWGDAGHPPSQDTKHTKVFHTPAPPQ